MLIHTQVYVTRDWQRCCYRVKAIGDDAWAFVVYAVPDDFGTLVPARL